MALELGVHIRSIQNWLRGVSVPDAAMLELLHRKFRVSPDWLVLGEGEMLSEPEAAGKETRSMLGTVRKLNLRRKRLLLDFVETLGRLQQIDKDDAWLPLLVHRGGAPFGLVQRRWQIEAKEWDVLEAFIDFEREWGAAEPLPEGKSATAWNQELNEAMEERIRGAKEARQAFESKLAELATMWADLPIPDERRLSLSGTDKDQ